MMRVMVRATTRAFAAGVAVALAPLACADVFGIHVLPGSGDAGSVGPGEAGSPDTRDAASEGSRDVASEGSRDAGSSDDAGCASAVASDGGAGYVAMCPPEGWTTSDRTFDDHFESLEHWNYGVTDDNASGADGGYAPWAASGTPPYWGSQASSYALDYDVPGNVFQTSKGYLPGTVSSYAPQAFTEGGWGVSFLAHYTGSRVWMTDPYGPVTLTWTSGSINSYNRVSFPAEGKTSCFVQIRAQMMGHDGSDNGAWNALWFLGQGIEEQGITLQSTGTGGQSPNLDSASLQDPVATIGESTSSADLASGYHVYGMELQGSKVSVYLDGLSFGTATTSATGPYFLLMTGNISAGMYGAAPAANVDMTMSVMEVQVYER
jgi:hypothetical protein